MDEPDRETHFLIAMTDVAQKVLQAENKDIYHLVMAEAHQFIDKLLGCSHDGGAYSLWMEVSDLYDGPRGPASEEACAVIGRKAAMEWLTVDTSSPEAVDTFFARWRTPEPWQLT